MTRKRCDDRARGGAQANGELERHDRDVCWCLQWHETADIAHTVLRGGRYQKVLVLNGREPIGRIEARHLADLVRCGALLTDTRAGDIMERLGAGHPVS